MSIQQLNIQNLGPGGAAGDMQAGTIHYHAPGSNGPDSQPGGYLSNDPSYPSQFNDLQGPPSNLSGDGVPPPNYWWTQEESNWKRHVSHVVCETISFGLFIFSLSLLSYFRKTTVQRKNLPLLSLSPSFSHRVRLIVFSLLFTVVIIDVVLYFFFLYSSSGTFQRHTHDTAFWFVLGAWCDQF